MPSRRSPSTKAQQIARHLRPHRGHEALAQLIELLVRRHRFKVDHGLEPVVTIRRAKVAARLGISEKQVRDGLARLRRYMAREKTGTAGAITLLPRTRSTRTGVLLGSRYDCAQLASQVEARPTVQRDDFMRAFGGDSRALEAADHAAYLDDQLTGTDAIAKSYPGFGRAYFSPDFWDLHARLLRAREQPPAPAPTTPKLVLNLDLGDIKVPTAEQLLEEMAARKLETNMERLASYVFGYLGQVGFYIDDSRVQRLCRETLAREPDLLKAQVVVLELIDTELESARRSRFR